MDRLGERSTISSKKLRLVGNRTNLRALPAGGRGPRNAECRVFPPTSRHLPSASGFSSSKEAANRLLVMARDYLTKVDAIEAESAMRTMIAPSASPDRETNGT